MSKPKLPSELREAVCRELYQQVHAMDWESMSDSHKTEQYSLWVDHPAIGGELADHFTAEGMRVWLKDGPMKEYARALEGVGQYAKYTVKRLTDIGLTVSEALGQEWRTVPGTLAEKPMHVIVTDGTAKRYVCWGQPHTLRDLLWAAVREAVDTRVRPLIIVTLRENTTLTGDDAAFQDKVAAHCGLDLIRATRYLVDKD